MFCTICLDNIQYKEIDTSCGHDYHQLCLSKWLLKDSKKLCPNCRLPISYVFACPQTRSKTVVWRTKKTMLELHYLMDLFLITLKEDERDRLIEKMFKKIYDNRIILKKNKHYWSYIKWLRNIQFQKHVI